jgi:predicted RNase H-like nuclease (RuvC/YqgF family)
MAEQRTIQVSREVMRLVEKRDEKIAQLQQALRLKQDQVEALEEIIAAYRDALASMQARDQLAAVINRAEMKPLLAPQGQT